LICKHENYIKKYIVLRVSIEGLSMPNKPKADRALDCIGLYCPEPVFRTRQELDKLTVGQVLEMIADDPAAEADIPSFAKRTGHQLLKMWKENNQIHFLIKKVK
jgi:TusA-related sulfurtransferase